MYELATGDWLFSPEDKDDIPRDIDHLAQMTRRIGQDHSDAALERFEIQKKQNNPKGKEMYLTSLDFIYPPPLQIY